MPFTHGQQIEAIAGVGPIETKTITFDGATVNDPGDYDGANNPFVLFQVTGLVAVKLYAVCSSDLTGNTATISVGTTITPAGLIAQTTATDIDAGEIWHDATPDASVEAMTVVAEKIVSQNIIQTIATANITGGTITYRCIWRPLSTGAQVVAAPVHPTTSVSDSVTVSESQSVTVS